ncbi:MAG TPA: DUF5946 family protein [Allosphingosinicella sp.]|nr:DUF5946 family protein [Allosphingosinicella sp.]
MAAAPCDECGWAAAGGREGCRARFDSFLARDFSDAHYFRTHRLFVDTYCLQHPDQFCASGKSLAAHLAGLGWILAGEASAAVGPAKLHRWLNGARLLDKPDLPKRRGGITVGDLPAEAPPSEWAEAVRRWAESTWAAYAPLHATARRWIAEAEAGL